MLRNGLANIQLGQYQFEHLEKLLSPPTHQHNLSVPLFSFLCFVVILKNSQHYCHDDWYFLAYTFLTGNTCSWCTVYLLHVTLCYIQHCQHMSPGVPVRKLSKQKFSAVAVSGCADCRWEGFIKGGERWQFIVMPWRQERLDGLDGDSPEALTKKKKEQLSLTHTWHGNIHKDIHTDTYVHTACTHTLYK